MSLTVLNPGVQSTVQDLGRRSWRKYGVALGCALDPWALRIANILVGNEEGAAGVEVLIGGAEFRLDSARSFAWGGSEFAVDAVEAGEISIPPGRRCQAPAGTVIRFRATAASCRAWLAISGGIDVAMRGGSRSTDLRGGFGGFHGRELRRDDVLPLAKDGLRTGKHLRIPAWGASPGFMSAPRTAELRVVAAHDIERAAEDGLTVLEEGEYVVTPNADRMGIRLAGAVIGRWENGGEMVSEPVVPGTIQLPPSGEPIVLLADAQTIGGYPRIACVITSDLRIAAQLRPGDRLRFRVVSPGEAHAALARFESDLERFRAGVDLKLQEKRSIGAIGVSGRKRKNGTRKTGEARR